MTTAEGGAATEFLIGGMPLLPDWVQRLSDSMDLEALADVVTARCLQMAFPQYLRDEDFVRRLRASIVENLHGLRELLCARTTLAEVQLNARLDFASTQVHLGIPQMSMQRSYRISFFTMWEAWSAIVREHAQLAGLPMEEAVSAITSLTRAVFGYQDHVASQVAESYARMDEALRQSRAQVRQRLVREVLRAESEALSPADILTIGYALESDHVAVLLPETGEEAASRLVAGLKRAARSQQALLYPLNLRRTVVWLSRVGTWTAAVIDDLCEYLSGTGVTAAVSSWQSGLDGFRHCLAQADEIERVRAAWGDSAPAVIQYADVRLEMLLLQDRERAQRFVRDELGALADDTVECRKLRETLEASFRLGSHVAAAEYLGVHEHTVRNRLHKAEIQLGRLIMDRRVEIQVAIRLQRLLSDTRPE
ncbi:MAG TPA: helix-turn-helix domain-containing protein [Micromonosporaceae bacterium]|nr:helix-turn-helix domain-containing protein [Micromonosporaceae bacterium]